MANPSGSTRGLRQSARDLRVDPQVVHRSGHNRDGNRRHTGAVLRRRTKVATLAHRDRADRQPDHDQQQQEPSHALQDTKTGDTTAKRCIVLGIVASPDLCQRRDSRSAPSDAWVVWLRRLHEVPAGRLLHSARPSGGADQYESDDQTSDTDHHQDDTHLDRLI